MVLHAWLPNLLVSLIRSATDFVACLIRRHFAFTFVRGWGAAAGWNHAGRVARTPGESLIAARFALYFFAMFNILLMSLFRFIARGLLVGGFHDWRKVFISATADIPGGADVFIRSLLLLPKVVWRGLGLGSLLATQALLLRYRL